MDVYSLAEAFENPVECAELREVLPAVDVLVFHVEDFLSELFGGVLGETGLADAGGTEEKRGVGGVAVGQRREDFGEMGDFGVAVFRLLGGRSRSGGPERRLSLAVVSSSWDLSKRVISGSFQNECQPR